MGKTEGLIWPGSHGSGEIELSTCQEVKFAMIGGMKEKPNFLSTLLDFDTHSERISVEYKGISGVKTEPIFEQASH